jgi:hypothetical protein
MLNQETAVRSLVDAIDTYLSTLASPGVSDVRDGIERFRHNSFRQQQPLSVPTLAHLEPALSFMDQGGQASFAASIRSASPLLPWITYDLYPREEIGAAFAENHAFVSLVGEGSMIPAEDFDLGLFLIAPHIFYRDHHHPAAELYAPVTGPHGWRFAPGDPLEWHDAHHPVWNEPMQHHATKVGNIPFLAIYGWTKNVRFPAHVIRASDWADIELTGRPLA